MNFTNRTDPFVETLPDARADPHSGVIIKKMAKKRQRLQTWWKMESMNVNFLNMKFNICGSSHGDNGQS